MDGWMDEGWMHVWVMDICIDEWMGEWGVGEWIDKRMHEELG